MEHFCWTLWWGQRQIVVSSSLMTGNNFVVVETERVLFVEIEFCWWKLRRIGSNLWQVSRKLLNVDSGVENWWRWRKKVRFHYGKNNSCVRFERFWVVLCASAMSSTENEGGNCVTGWELVWRCGNWRADKVWQKSKVKLGRSGTFTMKRTKKGRIRRIK